MNYAFCLEFSVYIPHFLTANRIFFRLSKKKKKKGFKYLKKFVHYDDWSL